MCGFAGVVPGQAVKSGGLESLVRSMCERIVHRGPDDRGVWSDPSGGPVLGFQRLAILDLSAHGHQPMHSASGRYTIVFNGEVYNHRSLRERLASDGLRFHGHSDTEVIAGAFDRWGIEASVRRFIGMFAMAIWDSQLRELSLVRDRLGIKPLFYSHRDGEIWFASELKALLESPSIDRDVDLSALEAYLRYLYIPAPQSIFRGVRKLQPGHILTFRVGSSAEPLIRPFWSLEEVYRESRDQPLRADCSETVEELTAILRDAVGLRMVADVPLGALLSGGIDSSLVVALMQEQAGRPTRTFSVGFPGTSHDEAAQAAAVADHLGTEHTQLDVTAADLLDVVPLLAEMYDEPLADPSQIPTYLVSRLARQDVVVALTGDGGDEVFGGYHRYVEGEPTIDRLARLPRLAQLAGAAIAGAGSVAHWDRLFTAFEPALPSSRRYRLPGTKVKKLERMLRAGQPGAMYRSLLSVSERPERLLHARERQPSRVDEVLSQWSTVSLVDRMMLVDQSTYLPDDLLAKVDRASMAVSLEARVPLLDHRVVEWAWRLPAEMKIRGNTGKWILQEVLRGYVPQELFDRPKVGFSVPIAEWLGGPLRPWAEELLFDRSLPAWDQLRIDQVHAAWKRVSSGASEHALEMWAIVTYLAWSRRWCR
jgi:asparagine synthase (glutamine-hydrolysing)